MEAKDKAVNPITTLRIICLAKWSLRRSGLNVGMGHSRVFCGKGTGVEKEN